MTDSPRWRLGAILAWVGTRDREAVAYSYSSEDSNATTAIWKGMGYPVIASDPWAEIKAKIIAGKITLTGTRIDGRTRTRETFPRTPEQAGGYKVYHDDDGLKLEGGLGSPMWRDLEADRELIIREFPAPAAKGKPGRKPAYYWPEVEQFVLSLFRKRGDYEDDANKDKDWSCQADLERAVADWLQDEHDVQPTESAIRENLAPILQRVRAAVNH
jgi:hypothetical protein